MKTRTQFIPLRVSLCCALASVLFGVTAKAAPLTLTGWGDNSAGQLNYPTNLTNAVSISGGGRHSLALNVDGAVAAWGDNFYGQCNVPTNLSAAVAIAAGSWHSLAILVDGTLHAWGWNADGQCNVPAGLSNVIAVAGGLQHSAALKSDGTVVAWGRDDWGQSSVPGGLSGVVGIALGKAHSLALKRDGTLVSWGANYSGQLSLPVTTNVAMVAAASDNTLILTRDGLVYACGFNQYGQNNVPAGLSNVVAISSGGAQHSALLSDGSVRNWGNISAPPASVSNVVAIGAGAIHNVALLGNGSPGITLQPVGDAVVTGTPTSFRAQATGVPPLAFQWRFNGAEISGGTNTDLFFTPAQPTHRGNYDLVVTNSFGAVTSLVAALVVNEIPAITNQPQNRAVPFGVDVTFSVGVHGTLPLAYQWSFNGANILNATNSSLTLSNVLADRAGNYQVLAANPFGMVTSAVATLSVTTSPPVITVPLTSLSATMGAEIIFAPTVLGLPPPAFQWFFNGAPLDGATNSTLELTNAQTANAGGYHFIAANEFGSVTSAVTTLAVTPPPGFLWARDGGGTNADEGTSVAVDPAGNVFVAGYFNDTATIGGSNLVSAGGSDFFVARYNAAGSLVWIRQGGGAFDDRAQSVAVDAAGNVFVAGYVNGSATIGGVSLTGFGGYDIFLARYDRDGNLLWATNAGSLGGDQALGVTVDNATNVYITGFFTSTATFGATNLVFVGGADIFVARYDGNGNCLWARKAGGSTVDQGRAVTCDTVGNVLVIGDFNSATAAFDSLTLTNTLASGAFGDTFVAKYDSAGNILWAARGGGTNPDFGHSIVADAAGNVFTFGEFFGPATFGNLTVNSAGSSDVFLAKYDTGGSLQWVKTAGGMGAEVGMSLARDTAGNLFAAGKFSSSANFGGTNQVSGTGNEIFVAMFAPNGDALWARRAGGAVSDYGNAIAADRQGHVYLSGFFNSSAEFGHEALTSSGGPDFFLAKLAAFGATQPPVVTVNPSNQTVLAGINVTLTPGFESAEPFAAQWLFNGAELTGATSATLTLSNASPAQAGEYSLVLSNANGAITSAVATISVTIEPDFVWARRGGGATNDTALATAADAAGNVYVAGYFTDAADFSGTNLVSNRGEDIFVAKYNLAGSLMWVRQFGSASNDRATALALVPAGGVAVCGTFSGSVTMGSTTLTNAGGTDAFLARLDANGNVTWAVRGGGPNDDVPDSVSVSALSSRFYIAGSFRTNATFGSTTFNDTSTTNKMFVAQYNGSGNFVWAVSSSGFFAPTRARAVVSDADNLAYVAGTFGGTAVLGSTSLSSTGALDVFVTKLTSGGGGVVWAKKFGTATNTPAFNDDATGIALDTSGNVFVTGSFQGETLFGGTNTASSFNPNQPDGFVLKLDNNGNALSVKTVNGPGAEAVNGVTVDAVGNAYVTGLFCNNAAIGGTTLSSAGGQEMFAALFDATGNLVKARRAGGVGDDVGQSIATDGAGNVFVAGSHSAPAAFGLNALSTAGARDAFVTRLSFFPAQSPPQITTPPRSQSVAQGSNATLNVGCMSGLPVNYQWRFHGATIPGATSNSFTLVNAQIGNTGDYTVVAQNAAGAVTSMVATVRLEVAPEFVWLRRSGNTGDDQALAVALDGTNAIYVAGLFTGTNPTFTNLASGGGADIFLAKYDGAGNFLWAQRAGGTLNDAAQAVRVDRFGNVFVAGYFYSSTATFGSVTVTNKSSPVASFSDLFLAKYDSDGNLLWVKTTSGSANDQATAIALDDAGNAYLTGSFNGGAVFGGIGLTNLNATNFFVAKYDGAGNVLWARTTSGTNYSQGSGICVDAATNVYVTGFLFGSLNLGSGVLTNTNAPFVFGNATVFIAKYDRNGAVQWVRKGPAGGNGYGQAVAADDFGAIYATSYKRDYGTSPCLTKYDAAGNVIWYRSTTLSCCTGDYLAMNALALDAFGNPLVTGFTTGSIIEGITNISYYGGYVLKYRSDGSGFWLVRCGSAPNGGTGGYGLAVDAAGNAFIAGRFTSTTFFGATSNLVSAGGNDAFVVKLGLRPPTISTPPTSQFVVTGSNVTLFVTASGTGPLGYQWQRNGVNLAGGTNSSLTLTGVQPSQAGAYSVVVRNTGGSVTSAIAVLTVIPVLSAEWSGQGVVFSWAGSSTLETATNPAGPYFDLPWTSPYTNAIDLQETQRFFRLRSPAP